MTLQIIRKTQLAYDLGLLDASGEISDRSVADLLRAALTRWGLSPKRAVLKYARDQLQSCGIMDHVNAASNVLQRLLTLGECVEVYVGHETYVTPAESRWMPVGDGVGVYLGVSKLPEAIFRAPTGGHRDIVQRICVASDDEAALLQVTGVREVSLAEWMSPVDYLKYAERRMRERVRSDTVTLSIYWDIIEGALAKEGLPLSTDAEVRAVTGNPGQFFGRPNATDPEGRWTVDVPDGVWCAFRRGYGEKHWHPTVIGVTGEEWRALDLYDVDEWRWALLARGRRLGSEEVVLAKDEQVRLTFPPPAQVGTAMDLLGVPTAPWVWKLNPGAPDVCGLIQ